MLKKIILSLIALSTILLIGFAIYAVYIFNNFESGVTNSFETSNREQSDLRLEDVDAEDLESFTILFMGVDERADDEDNNDRSSNIFESDNDSNEDTRTDTLILAMFNREADEMKMVSIPRDTLTFLPNENYFDKITHAHQEGGPQSTMLAVESLLNVPVDYYVRLNMQALVDMVDAIGGVTFEVPFDMNEPNSQDRGRIILDEGTQVLNGEEALAVVRSRRIDTDLGRGNRQLEMVEAIMTKAKSTGALTRLDSLIDVVSENARHNMPNSVVRSLASYYMFNDLEFTTTQILGDDYWYEENGAYFYDANEEHLYLISKTMREELQLPEPDPYDLINIRLSGQIEPYQYLTAIEKYRYRPVDEPYFMQLDYESPLNDGFDIDHEALNENVEGEVSEDTPIDDVDEHEDLSLEEIETDNENSNANSQDEE